MSGKNVPQKITKQRPTRTTLFNTNIDSRESRESKRPSGRRAARRLVTSATEPTIRTAISAKNGLPSVDAPNA